MSHYIYSPGPLNISAGGTVGYLTRLYLACEEYRPSMTTDLGTELIFCFAENKAYPQYINDLSKKVYINDTKHTQQLKEILELDKKFDHNTVRIKRYSRWFRELPKCQVVNNKDTFASVHINGAYSFLPIWNQLRLQGKALSTLKILTTHNPFPPHVEEVGLRKSRGKWSESELAHLKKYLEIRDKLAFSLCDAILCPCEYSLEGYQSWPEWNEIISRKPVYYCITGAPVRKIRFSKEAIRKDLGIPDNEIMIVYLGRKEKVRGFDVFSEAARIVLTTNKKVWFVVIGTGNLKSNIASDHFIEIGFSENISDYINAADACVVANRGSYFDLSMIEILSLGCLLITSEVGGYRWLKNKTEGVLYFEPGNVKQLVCAINSLSSLPHERRNQMMASNKKLYNDKLTPFHFQENYQNIIDKIRGDFIPKMFEQEFHEEKLISKVVGKNQELFNYLIRTIESFIKLPHK